MSGKCRPSLRRKTLKKLELCVKLHQISITDYECVKAAFERLAEHENSEKRSANCKTRQDAFLLQFPFARLDEDGILDIEPCRVDCGIYKPECFYLFEDECCKCRERYWAQGVK